VSASIRRLAPPVALIGIPFALLVGSFVSPTDSTDNAPQLRAAAAHGARWEIAAFLELLAAVLFPLAAVAVVRVVRERGYAWATAAAALAGLGSMGMAGIAFRHLFVYGLATAPQPTALHALDRVDNTAGPIVMLCMFAGPFALIALTVAASRAGLASRLTIAGAVVYFVSDMLPIPAAEEIQGVIGLVTFGYLALRMLESPSREMTHRREPLAAAA
jgi:hypothetical protein